MKAFIWEIKIGEGVSLYSTFTCSREEKAIYICLSCGFYLTFIILLSLPEAMYVVLGGMYWPR